MSYQLGTFVESEFLSQNQDDGLGPPQSSLPRWTDLGQNYMDAAISNVQDTNMYAGVADTSLDIDFDLSPCPSLNNSSSLEVDFNLSSCPSLNEPCNSDFGSDLGFGLVFGRDEPRMVPVPGQSEVGSLTNHWDLVFAPLQTQILPELDQHAAVPADNSVSDLPLLGQRYTPLDTPQSPIDICGDFSSKGTAAVGPIDSPSALDGLFRYPCVYPGCSKSFKRKEHSTRHYKSQHLDTVEYLVCEFCGKDTFNRKDNLNAHRKLHARRRKKTTGVHFVPEAAVALKHNRQLMRGTVQTGTRQNWTASSAGVQAGFSSLSVRGSEQFCGV